MGGLGNQLFQIITLIACSIEYKQDFVLEKKDKFVNDFITRDSYWNSLFLELKDNLKENIGNYNFNLIEEKQFNYKKIEIPNYNNYLLYGYFQSYKYFDKYADEIFKKLNFHNYKLEIGKKYSYDFDNTISLHFRFGDYIKLQNTHPLMTSVYYINSLQTIMRCKENKNLKVLYFCEESDIKYVNVILREIINVFPNLELMKVKSEMKDWEQLLLMSLCKYNIIANSSFSWWGAYLNTNINKIVCFPDKWFGKNISHDTSDLCPPEWIKCNAFELYNVYYINLLERIDRKELVERELNKLNWNYERFNAIKLKDGRVGCSMSHLKLLEMAKSKNLEYIVIVEDDIMFTNPDKFKLLLKNFNNMINDYDVLLLAGNLRPPYTKVNDNILKITKAWTTTGYIVRKHYYDKLINNIKEGIQLLMKYPEQHNLYAIDAYWQKLQTEDKHFILIPRTVTQRPNYSTIENRYTDYNHLMLDL
jgi:GR25 family glycosyltransferase involved in LPS biosynthesis